MIAKAVARPGSADLALSVLFTVVLTTIGAQIALPTQPVPVTLQTFAVILSGLLLGPKRAAMGQVAYVTMGSLGAPVFANFGAGSGHLFGPTGGYLAAFPVVAILFGQLALKPISFKLIVAAAVLSLVTLFIGSAWLSGFVGIQKAITVGLAPFVLFEILKGVSAVLIATGAAKSLAKSKICNFIDLCRPF